MNLLFTLVLEAITVLFFRRMNTVTKSIVSDIAGTPAVGRRFLRADKQQGVNILLVCAEILRRVR